MGTKIKKNNFNIRRITILFLALVYFFISAAPFYFMYISAFKNKLEFIKTSVWMFPSRPILSNFIAIIKGDFFIYLKNSIIVTAISVIIILIVSSLAAYIFARVNLKYNKIIFGFVIAGIAIPIYITLIPVYLMMQKIGLYDSIIALIGPYVAFNIPLTVFIFTEYMRTIPKELEEAAIIDGCNIRSIFFRIIVPLSKPAFATMAIYNTIIIWNEFVFVLVLVSSPANRTLPLGIWDFEGQYSMDTPKSMAFLALASLPLILVYLFAQGKIEKGIMAGALKK